MTINKCAVGGCKNIPHIYNLCKNHFELLSDTNKQSFNDESVAPEDRCLEDDCERFGSHKGYCSAHYQRKFRGRKATGPIRKCAEKGSGYIDSTGYHRIKLNGKTYPVHRYIYEQYIGRKLEDHETVHHINGNKLDNRLENLELWSKHQPSGQRTKDKLSYAKEIISLYEEEPLYEGYRW